MKVLFVVMGPDTLAFFKPIHKALINAPGDVALVLYLFKAHQNKSGQNVVHIKQGPPFEPLADEKKTVAGEVVILDGILAAQTG